MEQKLDEILAPYKGLKGASIPVLQKVQETYGYLPEEVIPEVAKFLGLSRNEVYGVASFYAQFRFERQGEYTIKVCQGTACHVKGSHRILEEVIDELGLQPGETSKDFRFSVERVACVGCCALAPVMLVNDTVYAKMTVAGAKKIMEDIGAKASKQAV